MRTLDQTPPAVTVDTHPQPWGRGRLVVALERLPQAAYVWDDPDPTVVWENADPAVLLVDPCENFTFAPWTLAGSPTVVAGGHDGGNCFRLPAGSANQIKYNIAAAAQTDRVTVGAWFKLTPGGVGWQLITLRSDAGATLHTRLEVTSTGVLAVISAGVTHFTTPAGTMPVNTWVYIELAAKLGDGTNGSVTLRVDSVQVGTATGDTKNAGTKTVYDAVWIQSTGSITAWNVDEIYIRNDNNYGTGPPAAGDPLVWDAPFIGSGFTDVWCDMSQCSIVHGEPDPTDMYRLSACQLELVDPDGRYRSRTPDGQLIYYAPGRRLAVWWQDDDDSKWWLFSGLLATWRERFDGTVAIEAYSGEFLGQAPGVSWTAGSNGQLLSARVASILTAAGYTGAHRSDLGLVALLVPEPADTAAIDMVRQAAWSGGGIVYTDADDTLVVRDRLWRDGRTDQTSVPILTDNVCNTDPGAVVVWEPEAADDDLRMAGTVRLENIADPALTAVASAPATPPGYVDPRIVFTHPGPDLWTTQSEGDALAAHILAERRVPRLALGSAALYMHDRRFDYWPVAMNLRLGDLVRFVHDDYGTLYDITAVVTTVRHQIGPDTWLVTLATSPAVDYTPIEAWDQTRFYWDDTDPLAAWR